MIASVSENNKFPIYEISIHDPQRPEMLGTKEKFWLSSAGSEGPTEFLFKVGRVGTGENWSEKICCELAKVILLPCAEYDFATCQEINGVISKRFFDPASTLLPGNLLLANFVDNYDHSKKYNQISYTLAAVLGVLRRMQKPQLILREFVGMQMKEVEVFAGYLVFDAWIGNTDRHHENWGLIATKLDETDFVARLAPAYDHASSLGRELSDEKKAQLLKSKDDKRNIVAYTNRGHSAFSGKNKKTITHEEVLTYLMAKYPEATRKWAEIVCTVKAEQMFKLFQQVDDAYISEISITFAIHLLELNSLKIQKVCFGA